MSKLNKKGFTLAELLVVVGIIAVLVAISIPVFSSQTEKAKQAVDLANIRSAYAQLADAVIGEDRLTNNGEGKTGNLVSNSSIRYQKGETGKETWYTCVELSSSASKWDNADESIKSIFDYIGANDGTYKTRENNANYALISYQYQTNGYKFCFRYSTVNPLKGS